MSEVVQQKVFVTQGGRVVQKNVLDLAPDESDRISVAIDQFLHVTRQLEPDFNDGDLQTIIERCDATGRPADDVMSYTFARNEIAREARKRMEDAIKARERESQSLARESQLRAEREEYLQPSNRDEVARELQQNQPAYSSPARPTREYTDAELDAMSSEDMVRLGLMTRAKTIEERQGTGGIVLRPERPGERKERRIKFSPEELAAQESRKRVIAQDKAERQRLLQDAQRTRDEQQRRALDAREKRRGR